MPYRILQSVHGQKLGFDSEGNLLVEGGLVLHYRTNPTVVDGSGGGGVGTSESITSGADPVAVDPDKNTTIITTGGTKGTETVTLANPTDPSSLFIKTILAKFTHASDNISLQTARAAGFPSTLAIKPNMVNNSFGVTAVVQFIWNPAVLSWQALVGGSIFINSAQDLHILDASDIELRDGAAIVGHDGGAIDLRDGGAIKSDGPVQFSGLSTSDQNDGITLWVDAADGYRIKRSTP